MHTGQFDAAICVERSDGLLQVFLKYNNLF